MMKVQCSAENRNKFRIPISSRRARKLASFLTFVGAVIVVADAVALGAPEIIVTNDNRNAGR